MGIVVIFTRYSELNGTTQFLGVCEESKQKKFYERIDALCKAMDWSSTEIQTDRCYLNHIEERFPLI